MYRVFQQVFATIARFRCNTGCLNKFGPRYHLNECVYTSALLNKLQRGGDVWLVKNDDEKQVIMCKLPSESFVQSVHCPSKVSVCFQSVLSKVSDVSFLNKFCSDLPTRCNTEYPSKFWHDLFTCVIE